MPRVSVILPTYNRPRLLYRALMSVAGQTYRDFEVIVVNDGGQSITEIVSRFPFARLLVRETNGGLSAARNTGIESATGHYLAYLDDDDMWLPEHLETCLEFLETIPSVRACYSNCYRWYNEKLLMYGQNRESIIKEDDQRRRIACIINLVHERSLIDEVGGFDEDMREMEDWDFVIKMNRHTGGMMHANVYTAVYSKRNDADQLTSDQERMTAAWHVIKERYGLSREKPSFLEREYGNH